MYDVRREGRSTVLKGHTAAVRAVTFSADGKSLITAGNDKSIKVRLAAPARDVVQV